MLSAKTRSAGYALGHKNFTRNKNMAQDILALITDEETVSINGRSYSEKSAIAAMLKEQVDQFPNLTITIEPDTMEFFRAIGKVIYASQIAGVDMHNLRIRNEDGSYIKLPDSMRLNT